MGRGSGLGTQNTPLSTRDPREGASFEFRFSNLRFRLLAAAFCLLLTAFSLFAMGGRYTVTEVKPHVFVWVPEEIHDIDGDPKFTLAGTAGFIIGPEGVIVINTANTPYHGREILYEIRQRTDLPVKYVINTDSRGSHILGNEAFTDQRAVIISTPLTAIEMSNYRHDLVNRMAAGGEEGLRMRQRMRGIHFTMPTQEISKDMTIGVGGEEVRLLLPMAGPSPGNLVVYLPRSKVLFLGDLWQNGTPRKPKDAGTSRRTNKKSCF